MIELFYYYATIQQETINFEREAKEEEYNSLEPYISKISKMLIDKRRIGIVLNAHNKVVEEFAKLTSEYNAPHNSNDLIFSLTYYLAAFKKYLDNWETHLKRAYGDDSKEVKLFKDAQSQEYDNHIEYRIFYRLRNFDQHCGNLVLRITGQVLPDDTRQYLVLADRDRLLREFKEWKPEEITYLESCEQYFNIRPLIDVFQNCIIAIHEKTMQIHFNEDFYRSCATIVAAAKEFENEDNTYFISFESEIDWKSLDIEGKSLNLTYLEVPVCKKLLEIYFLNNRSSIKILYCGTQLKQRIGNFAYEIDHEKAHEVAFTQPPFVDMCGQRMIRLCSHAFLEKDEVFCVLADHRYPRKQQQEISDTWGFLLDSFVKV